MKKTFFFLFSFLFSFFPVFASELDEKLIHVINEGDITKKYLEELEQNQRYFTIYAKSDQENIITIHFTEKNIEDGGEAFEAIYTLMYKKEENAYVLSYLVGEKEREVQQEAIRYMQIISFYGVEMSDSYSNLKDKLQNRDYLSFYRETFDRCYIKEMGTCFTEITQYKALEYLVKIEVNDKAYEYALKALEKVEEKEEEILLYKRLFFAAGVLLLLIGFVFLLRLFIKEDKGKNRKFYSEKE